MTVTWKELREKLSSERGKWRTPQGYWINAAEELLAEVDRLGDSLTEIEQLRECLRSAELEALHLRSALAALVEALPRCYECDRPLTKALDIDNYGHCDVHGEYKGEASWAEPLRAAQKLLGE